MPRRMAPALAGAESAKPSRPALTAVIRQFRNVFIVVVPLWLLPARPYSSGVCQAIISAAALLLCVASQASLACSRVRKRASGPARKKKSFSVLCFAETEAAGISVALTALCLGAKARQENSRLRPQNGRLVRSLRNRRVAPNAWIVAAPPASSNDKLVDPDRQVAD